MTSLEAPVNRLGNGTDRGAYIYACVFGASLYAAILIAPLLAARLAAQYGLSATQIGLIFSAEMAAFSLAGLPAYLWSTRVNLQTVSYLCTAIVVGGNLISGFISSFPALLATRVVTAAAAGSITVIILSINGRTSNPSRSFGMFVVAQLLVGAVGLAVIPRLMPDSGASSVYWILAGLTAMGFGVVRLIDGDVLRTTSEPVTIGADHGRSSGTPVRFVLGMGAVFTFYVALSGVWTFVGRIADSAGNDSEAISTVLSIATVAGVLSALLAAVIGDYPRQYAFLLVAYTVLCTSILLLFGAPTLIRFAVAAMLFKFAWTFVLPYLLSGLSALSSGTYVMSTTNLMIGAGFAVGPLTAGYLIDRSGGFSMMLMVSFTAMVSSTIFAALALKGVSNRAGEIGVSVVPLDTVSVSKMH